MDGNAGGHLAAASAHADKIAAARGDARLPIPSDDEDCDDLYSDVNVGFLPLLPLSPSPAPTSPPKTPSPGRSPAPSPPPHRVPSSEPQPEPKSATPGHQPPRPPPAQRHHMPQPQRVDASSLPLSGAVYISELHWWTTDAEVEAALAPHAAPALLDLYFYADKYTGKSRGVCRVDFLHRSAAASAAAALHGRAFDGRHCVASLSRPPALHRLGDDSDSFAEAAAQAPNPPEAAATVAEAVARATRR